VGQHMIDNDGAVNSAASSLQLLLLADAEDESSVAAAVLATIESLSKAHPGAFFGVDNDAVGSKRMKLWRLS